MTLAENPRLQPMEPARLAERVEAEIQTMGGPQQVAEFLDIRPQREPHILEREIEMLVHHRLARVIAALPETQTQAAIVTQAKLGRGVIKEDAAEAERQKSSLALAQTMIRKHGIPPQYQEAVRAEAAGWKEFVTSGVYDETVASIKTHWKAIKEAHRDEKPDGMSDDEFFTKLPPVLIARRATAVIQPVLTSISDSDIAYLMQKVRPYNRNTAVMQMIADTIQQDPTLLDAPAGQILQKLKPDTGASAGYTVFAPAMHTKKQEGHKVDAGTIDATGLDWKPIIARIQTHPDIARVSFSEWGKVGSTNVDTIQLGIEYCPLYVAGGKLNESSLVPAPQGKEAIVASRVGKKWGATHAVLEELRDFASQQQKQVKATVTFADWAVLAGDEQAANREILAQHARLYEEQAGELLQSLGIAYTFQRFSDVAKDALYARGIDQFVISSHTGSVAEIPTDLDELISVLALHPTDLDLSTPGKQQRARRILKDLLTSCEGNIASARGLAAAYIIALPRFLDTSDFHVGMERSDNLLELPTLAQKRKPAINILVS